MTDTLSASNDINGNARDGYTVCLASRTYTMDSTGITDPILLGDPTIDAAGALTTIISTAQTVEKSVEILVTVTIHMFGVDYASEQAKFTLKISECSNTGVSNDYPALKELQIRSNTWTLTPPVFSYTASCDTVS